MNELHKAYNALGLEPGAPIESIKRRYRRLVMVWHPDRMAGAYAKREAEEELKQINNSFEILNRHFQNGHVLGPNCRCQPAAAGPPPKSSGNSSTSQDRNSRSQQTDQTKRQQDQEAERRAQERRRRAAEAEAARRASEAAKRAYQNQSAAEDAISAEVLRKDEERRWRCALAILITFALLIGYCWLGCTARELARSAERGWQQFQEKLKPLQPTLQPQHYKPYRNHKHRSPFADPGPPSRGQLRNYACARLLRISRRPFEFSVE